MDTAPVTVIRTVWEEPDHVIGGCRGIRLPVEPLKVVAGVLAPRDQLLNPGRARRIENLVGVEHQDPRAGRLRQSVIAGAGEINLLEVKVPDDRAVGRGNLATGVRRARIHNDDLAGPPADRVQTT